jgi:two-component SAPR family response regulator
VLRDVLVGCGEVMAEAVVSRPTILVVGDQVDICEILQRMLVHITSSYESVAIDDTQRALDLLAERPVALVFVHVRLRDMAGIPIATTIKTRSPSTRVVLFSAMDVGALNRHAQVLKLDGYLVKPFRMADVAQLVSSLLP